MSLSAREQQALDSVHEQLAGALHASGGGVAGLACWVRPGPAAGAAGCFSGLCFFRYRGATAGGRRGLGTQLRSPAVRSLSALAWSARRVAA